MVGNMSLGETLGLIVGIPVAMLVMLFGLAAVEEGMFASVLVDPQEDETPAVLDADETEPLRQVA